MQFGLKSSVELWRLYFYINYKSNGHNSPFCNCLKNYQLAEYMSFPYHKNYMVCEGIPFYTYLNNIAHFQQYNMLESL